MIFTNAKQVGSDPQVIAEVIEEAIVSKASKLRYPAGADVAECRGARVPATKLDRDKTDISETGSFAEMGKLFAPPE